MRCADHFVLFSFAFYTSPQLKNHLLFMLHHMCIIYTCCRANWSDKRQTQCWSSFTALLSTTNELSLTGEMGTQVLHKHRRAFTPFNTRFWFLLILQANKCSCKKNPAVNSVLIVYAHSHIHCSSHMASRFLWADIKEYKSTLNLQDLFIVDVVLLWMWCRSSGDPGNRKTCRNTCILV